MQKEKLKHNATPVGVAPFTQGHVSSVAHKFAQLTEGDPKGKRGITLIALIITIIVMLILVAVTVTVALKGELFKTAKDASQRTESERDKEIVLSDGRVEVDGVWYETMDDYLNNKPIVVLPEGWTKTEKPAEWDNDKVVAVTDGTKIIPLPEGFQVSLKYGENTVDRGLVITDGTNEFVWIPVMETYTEDNLGPLTGTDSASKYVWDSQEQLDYYYGEGYFNYSEDFNYAEDKTKIEASINKYKGFYVGRYETTIDEEGNIGSKANTPVLTTEHTIKEGTNPNNNEAYYYRWYGLYKVQKDLYAEHQSVFSTMITSKEWDEIMDFTGYGSTKRGRDTYTTKPALSGTAYSTNPNKYDVSKNIYDLAGNVWDWTLTPFAKYARVRCGGYYYFDNDGTSYSASSHNTTSPYCSGSQFR